MNVTGSNRVRTQVDPGSNPGHGAPCEKGDCVIFEMCIVSGEYMRLHTLLFYGCIAIGLVSMSCAIYIQFAHTIAYNISFCNMYRSLEAKIEELRCQLSQYETTVASLKDDKQYAVQFQLII